MEELTEEEKRVVLILAAYVTGKVLRPNDGLPDKVQTIKMVREVHYCGLKEAKDCVDFFELFLKNYVRTLNK